jgi:hypothetical protein
MSRPRKPFGSAHRGRLPATMVKVLAAEMSDPTRLRRGKQYAHDGSVTDIIIEPGLVTCEVQGSRPTPYIAQVEVAPGDGMPLRRDITAQCTCPDDENWDNRACKHVVAAMFVLSDELLLEPELLDVWRGREPGSTAGADDGPTGHEPVADRPTGERSHLRLVHSLPGRTRSGDATGEFSIVPDVEPDANPDDERRHRIETMLEVPGGAELPDVPVLDRVDLAPPRRHELGTVLSDALRHLRVDWD